MRNFVFLCFACLGSMTWADMGDLEARFLDPPRSAKPHTWYHMMNGNVTKEGITRDFEALAEAGFGGVQMFDAGCNIPPGGLDFNSPAWFDMFRHAASEARRLGLEICIPNCSGWSSSGGPWNPPSNGMKRVVFSETQTRGPSRFHAKLPRETKDNGFYADIAVVAFPTPSAESVTFADVTTKLDEKSFVFSSDAPFTLSGFSYQLDYGWAWSADADIRIEVSDDGTDYRPFQDVVVALARSGSRDTSVRFHAFAGPLTARAIRISVVRSTVPVKVKLARPEAKMAISDLPSKTFAIRQEVKLDTSVTTSGQTVAKGDVRLLTGKLSGDGTLDWEVPAGDWTIVRVGFICNGKCNHPASDHGRGLEVDKLSAAAMDYHFEQYVARLCRTLGPLAGKVETGFNNILVDSYEVGSQNWTQGLEREFLRRRGYDLTPYLPVFAGRVVGSVAETERFLEDFRRVVADLFAENYAGKLAAKCREYGLLCSIEPYGNCPSDNLQYGQYADIPMGEFWSNAAKPYNPYAGNSKFVSYVSHVWGKPICATESFTANPATKGSGRWQTTPFSIKAQGDMAYAAGVNRLIYHRFAHQPWADDKYLPGMTMGRWGMHLDRTQTWWPYAKPFFRYQARCQHLLQRGTFVADALFFTGEDAPNQGGNRDGATQDPSFALPVGYDWDVCPTDALLALRVEGGEVVVPGGVRYRLLVLPSVEAMSLRVMKTVARLQREGAKIAWARKPVRAFGLSDGVAGDEEVRRLADAVFSGGILEMSAAEALAKLGLAPQIRIVGKGLPKDVKRLNWIHRREAGADWFFTAMPNREPTELELSFRVGGREPEIWDAETGRIAPAAAWRMENGRTVVRVPFDVCGSKFVVFRKPTTAAGREAPAPDTVRTFPVEGPWSVSFPNGFLPNPLAKGSDETVTFGTLTSWSDRAEDGIRYFSGSATYRKTIVLPTDIPKGARVELELGKVCEVAEVTVNGKTFDALWHPPYRVDITDALGSSSTCTLSVRVANLWANRLIGDDRQYAPDCEWKGCVTVDGIKEIGIKEIPKWVKEGKPSPTGRHTFTTWQHWNKDDELLPSGLLGPVKLRVLVKNTEAADVLVRYPDYPAAIERDQAYQVCVCQGSKRESLVVWNHCEKSALADRTRGGDVNRRFCEFAFAGRPVTVDIAVREDVRCYKVFPARRRLRHAFTNGVISVTLDEPCYFGIQLNDYDKTILSVFADAPERDVPDRTAPGVLTVEGWFDAKGSDGVFEVPKDVREVYLAPGSVMNARLKIRSPKTKLHGRGMVLDPMSDVFRYDQSANAARGLVGITADGVTVDGVKLVDARTFNFVCRGRDCAFHNVKTLASMMCSDGFTNGGRGLLVDNAWVYVGDNALVVSDVSEATYRNVVIGTSCKAIFPQGTNRGIKMEHVDVFRADEGVIANQYNGVLRRNNKWSELGKGLQKREPTPQDLQPQTEEFFFDGLSAVDATYVGYFFNGRNMGYLPKTFAFSNLSVPLVPGTGGWRGIGRTNGVAVAVENDPKRWLLSGNYTLTVTNLYLAGAPASRFPTFAVRPSDPTQLVLSVVTDSAVARTVPLAPDRREVNWTCPDARKAKFPAPPENLLSDNVATHSIWQRSPSWLVKFDACRRDEKGRVLYRLFQCEKGAGIQAVLTERVKASGFGTYRLSFEAKARNATPFGFRISAASNERKTAVEIADADRSGAWKTYETEVDINFDPAVSDLVSLMVGTTAAAEEVLLRNFSLRRIPHP